MFDKKSWVKIILSKYSITYISKTVGYLTNKYKNNFVRNLMSLHFYLEHIYPRVQCFRDIIKKNKNGTFTPSPAVSSPTMNGDF